MKIELGLQLLVVGVVLVHDKELNLVGRWDELVPNKSRFMMLTTEVWIRSVESSKEQSSPCLCRHRGAWEYPLWLVEFSSEGHWS